MILDSDGSEVLIGKGVKVLHIAETLPGGPASYLKEVLPHQVKKFGSENVAVLVPADQTSHLGDFAGKVFTFDREGRNLKSFLSLENAIVKIMNDKWDVVHLHSSFAGAVFRLSPRVNIKLTARVVYCAHCWAFDRPRLRIWEYVFILLERFLTIFTDAIISISPHESKMLKKYGFPSRKVKQIVSGISDIKIDSSLPKRPSEKIKFLFVGRFDRQKGIDLLLNQLSDFHLPFELTVVGAGVLENGAEYIFPKDTKLLGWVDRNDIADIMRQADYLLLPSRWEGMPLVALEALRAGLPIIANNIGAATALSDMVIDGVSPVSVIDFHKMAALADYFRMERPSIEVLSRAARDLYVAACSEKMMNASLVDLYIGLIEAK